MTNDKYRLCTLHIYSLKCYDVHFTFSVVFLMSEFFIAIHVQERKTINRLRVEFNEADPQDIKGKYSHKIYGYLLPPEKGTIQYMYMYE